MEIKSNNILKKISSAPSQGVSIKYQVSQFQIIYLLALDLLVFHKKSKTLDQIVDTHTFLHHTHFLFTPITTSFIIFTRFTQSSLDVFSRVDSHQYYRIFSVEKDQYIILFRKRILTKNIVLIAFLKKQFYLYIEVKNILR